MGTVRDRACAIRRASTVWLRHGDDFQLGEGVLQDPFVVGEVGESAGRRVKGDKRDLLVGQEIVDDRVDLFLRGVHPRARLPARSRAPMLAEQSIRMG